jgi:hypothetical protein
VRALHFASSGRSIANLFAFRAGRALLIGAAAMAAVAWVISVPGVVFALLAGAAAAVFTYRMRTLGLMVAWIASSAVGGALIGSVQFGRGTVTMRLLAALIASLAVVPWCVVLAVVLRARWAQSH